MFWLLFQFFAAFDGFCDALLYAAKGADSFKWNEHNPLVLRRCAAVLAALGAGFGAWWVGPDWLAWLGCQVAASMLSFSLFHNEVYNFTRVWINEQDLRRAWSVFRFNYQSTSTSARFDFDGPMRWWMAAAGLVVFVAGLLYFLLR